MGTYKRLEVYSTMLSTGIIPLFYNNDLELTKKVVSACYDGGARIFEFTNRGGNASEIFKELLPWCNRMPGMILGIGSIVDPFTASHFIQMGANFIVSPIFNEEVGLLCNRRKIAWIPGCATVTEVNKAEELGAEIVKIFPAQQVGGPKFIKALKGPLPWSNLMPSGGVVLEEENILNWLEAGAVCLGIGSNLINLDGNGNVDFSRIKENMQLGVKIFKKHQAK